MENIGKSRKLQIVSGAIVTLALLFACIGSSSVQQSGAQPNVMAPQGSGPAKHKPTAEENQRTLHNIISQIPLHFAKEIPVNFPIPTYPNNVTSTTFSNSIKGTPSATAMIMTKDSPKSVFQWYQDSCAHANWMIKTPTPQALAKMTKKKEFYMMNAQKDNQQVTLFCLADTKSSGTIVSISWCKTK